MNWKSIFILALMLPARLGLANDFIKSVAHSDTDGSTVLELYRVTELGPEVDALSEPTGGGFEYWPYVYDAQTGTHPSPYPDRVQWGFRAGGDKAKRCMKLSWHIWQYVTANPPEHLVELMAMDDAPNSYFHWNNDYTAAQTEDVGYRTFWHYNRPSGLLKWISHTKMDGRCQHPTVEAIDLWADCEIRRLNNASNQCTGHN